MNFKELPFLNVDKENVKAELENKRFAKILVDVFDGDLWSSKVSLIGNSILIFLIALSTFAVLLSTKHSMSGYYSLLISTYSIIGLIFTVEIGLRLILAGCLKPEYKGFKGKLKYLVSFYSIVDLISISPFLAAVAGFPGMMLIKPILILRCWRLVRFVPALDSYVNAFKNKKNEIFVSFVLVLLMTLTVSSFLYHVERQSGSEGFESIFSALVWSVGKFTGNYAGFANYKPVTLLGQLLATFNGLLGIGIFVLPAGLLSSGFIHELGERKKKEENQEREKAIIKLIGKTRYSTLNNIQSKLLYSNDEIFLAIRSSKYLRFRAMKSKPDILYNDIKILESFSANTSYGICDTNQPSKVTIINPIGYGERGISHFSRMVSENLGYNYFSKEYPMTTTCSKAIKISGSQSRFYESFESNKSIMPSKFGQWINDLKNKPEKKEWVIIFRSAASGRTNDFHFTYGNTEGADSGQFAGSTIRDYQAFEKFYSYAEQKCKDRDIIKRNKSKSKLSFEIGQHEHIGTKSDNELGFFLFKNSEYKNILTVYVNINLLIGEDDRYYEGVKFFTEIFGTAFGNFKKSDNS